MKHLYYIILLSASLLCGCNRNYLVYEDAMGAQAYFLEAIQSDVYEVSAEMLDASGRVWLHLYNSGYDKKPNHIRIVADAQALAIRNREKGTDVKMTPEKYWALDESEVTLDSRDNVNHVLGLILNINAFKTDGIFPGDFLLPLTLTGETDRNTRYDKRTLFVKIVY